MKILALDQATTTGFAVVNENGNILDSGVWLLADKKRTGESRGMRYVRFRHNLEEIFRKHPEISMIVHEQTLLRGGAATEIANGLKALILEQAELRHVEVSCVHTSELKKFATGNGKAEKPDMEKACFALSGISPRDDNEADAILIGLFASSRYGAFQAPQWPVLKKGKKRKKDWLDDLTA